MNCFVNIAFDIFTCTIYNTKIILCIWKILICSKWKIINCFVNIWCDIFTCEINKTKIILGSWITFTCSKKITMNRFANISFDVFTIIIGNALNIFNICIFIDYLHFDLWIIQTLSQKLKDAFQFHQYNLNILILNLYLNMQSFFLMNKYHFHIWHFLGMPLVP